MEEKVLAQPPKIWIPSTSTFSIAQKATVGGMENENFCVQYDPDEKYFAVGNADGSVRVYNALSGKLMSHMYTPPPATKLPITCLKWKPQQSDMKTTNILAVASSDGYITYWHATTGKCIISIPDPNSSDLYALDFSKDGSLLAAGGKDYEVKIYDDSTKSLVTTLKAADTVNVGHSNRIFSVRFTDDPNLLVSGGWDNTVFLWDLRESRSVGFMYGPHICGDSIDIRGDVMLTGSYSNQDVLQLWSLSQRKLIQNIKWDPYSGQEYDHGYLYTALFEKGLKARYIAAGGAGKNEMHLFKNVKDYELVAKVAFPKTVTSIDFANDKHMLAVACGDGLTYTFAFEDTEKFV